jgi:hypothetical protein
VIRQLIHIGDLAVPARARVRASRLRGELGQGSIEYLGVIIAAALIVLAIIAVASGIGSDIAGGIRDQVENVIGGSGEGGGE